MGFESVWELDGYVWDEKEFHFQTWETIDWVRDDLDIALKAMPDFWKPVEEWRVD